MSRYFCDLHIHSCLSPCGDEDMTPGNIAGMAVLNGLNIVALTDHNSAKNCPAFFGQAKALGLIPVAGMELTTAEDIHVICLFPDLEGALAFDRFVEEHRPQIPNRADIFGRQLLIGEDDEPTGEYPWLLINASDLSLEDAYREVTARGGACYPAHIDRPANGIVSTLGEFSDSPPYTAYELKDAEKDGEYKERFPRRAGLVRTVASDAHYLQDISEASFSLEIDDEPYSSDFVRRNLIRRLRGETKGGSLDG